VTLAGAYAQIRQLGRITGHGDNAAALVARMKAKIDAVIAARKGVGSGRSVYHELDQTLFTATSKTFIGRIYQLFGLRNIADAADTAGSGYPQLSAEYVVEQNPDLIVLADTVCCGQTAATVAARPGWDHIRAVRTASIVRLNDSIASRWGPRIVQLVQAVGRALARSAQ
jgi:iron complex transport system substrate-binding protein